MTYANGDKYIGEWKKAEYFGKGTYIYSNGDKSIFTNYNVNDKTRK